MKHIWISVIYCITFSKVAQCQLESRSFPKNFKIGTAVASYQIEGAWNVSDKSENVWDWYTHTYPERIADRSNGDIACDSYHKYLEDVQIIKSLGVDYHRFSISWSRILPHGYATRVSKGGIQYYKNLIRALLGNGIEPVVTIYHWDHPKIFEEMGGWTNELMVKWFADYARIIFEELGPMVKTFITINEPTTYCQYGYNDIMIAPGKILENTGQYLCIHNTLKAHATVYHMYDDEYRPTQKGQIGLLTDCRGWVPGKNTNDASIEQYFQFNCGWVMHPIYNGDYPQIMKTRIAMISKHEGHSSSRLPEFSEEWIKYIRGTSDFFGLNYYMAFIPVFDPNEKIGKYTTDSGIINLIDPHWPTTVSPAIYVVPAGFGNLLRMIRDQYNNPPLYVLENGYPDIGESADYNRIRFYYDYISELLTAIKEHGCNVLRYTVWSLLDSFEWNSGYSITFGIVHVDFESANRTRSAKLSTLWWQKILRSRTLQDVPTMNKRC